MDTQKEIPDEGVDLSAILRYQEDLESRGFTQKEVQIMVDVAFYREDHTSEEQQQVKDLFASGPILK
jgi:hypothetical protein